MTQREYEQLAEARDTKKSKKKKKKANGDNGTPSVSDHTASAPSVSNPTPKIATTQGVSAMVALDGTASITRQPSTLNSNDVGNVEGFQGEAVDGITETKRTRYFLFVLDAFDLTVQAQVRDFQRILSSLHTCQY